MLSWTYYRKMKIGKRKKRRNRYREGGRERNRSKWLDTGSNRMYWSHLSHLSHISNLLELYDRQLQEKWLLPTICSSDTRGSGLDPKIIDSILSIDYGLDKVTFRLIQRNHSLILEIHQSLWSFSFLMIACDHWPWKVTLLPSSLWQRSLILITLASERLNWASELEVWSQGHVPLPSLPWSHTLSLSQQFFFFFR